MGMDVEKPDFVAMKSADQTAHMHCLISTFDISSLESIMAELATCKISIFQLVSVTEQTGFSLSG